MNVEVLADSEALAQRAVEHLVAAAAAAIDERGRFVWAVSGGSTPRRMLQLLSERDDLDEACSGYASLIDRTTGSPAVFDVIQLGMGSDGHTASLIPDDPILGIDDRDVAMSELYQGRTRMSLTWPVLDRAKQLLWVIGGESKVDAVEQFLSNDPSIPATLPTQARALVLLDEAAKPN